MKRYLSLTKRPKASNRPFVQGSGVHQNPKQERKEIEEMNKLEAWKTLK